MGLEPHSWKEAHFLRQGKFTTVTSLPHNEQKECYDRNNLLGVIPGLTSISAKGQPKGLQANHPAFVSHKYGITTCAIQRHRQNIWQSFAEVKSII